MSTELSAQMRRKADDDNLDCDHSLRLLADEFDEAAKAFAAEQCTVREFMGAWARARKAWCEYSGLPLV